MQCISRAFSVTLFSHAVSVRRSSRAPQTRAPNMRLRTRDAPRGRPAARRGGRAEARVRNGYGELRSALRDWPRAARARARRPARSGRTGRASTACGAARMRARRRTCARPERAGKRRNEFARRARRLYRVVSTMHLRERKSFDFGKLRAYPLESYTKMERAEIGFWVPKRFSRAKRERNVLIFR